MRSGVVLLALILGCTSYDFVEKAPERRTEENIKITIAPVPADVLLVVDNSGSMEDEQENLARNFDAFINAVAGAGGDYRLAIVTTDMLSENGNELSGVTHSSFASSDPNKFDGQLDRSGCSPIDIQHACFRGPGSSATRVVSSAQSASEQARLFADNVRVGSCGSGSEQGLAAMSAALANTAPGRCNEGFLRQEANLVLIFVSDEEDVSPGQVSGYVDALAAVKPIDQVRVAVIAGAHEGEAANCGVGIGASCGGVCERFGPPTGSMSSCLQNADCPSSEACLGGACVDSLFEYWNFGCHWCSFYNAADCCSALAGSRYVELARQVEARVSASSAAISQTGCQISQAGGRTACVVDSICQENFGETLARIARDLVIPSELRLDPPASYPAGVTVLVDGAALRYGVDFVVSDDGRTLTFYSLPGENQTVEVFAIID